MDSVDLTEDARDDVERRFLGRLTQLQPPYCDVWVWPPPRLVITVDVSDRDVPLVLRTLRVDFDGKRTVAGNDPSHQIADELDRADPDRHESPAGLSPEELAEGAMGWFRAQTARPIERQEWDIPDSRRRFARRRRTSCLRRWVLADSEKTLAVRQGDGTAWDPGGAWGDPLPTRPPDRVIPVR